MIWTGVPWMDKALEAFNDILHQYSYLDDLIWYGFWFFQLLIGGPLLALLLPWVFLANLFGGHFGPLQRTNKPTKKAGSKAVLVTGCDRGFGRGLAVQLSQEGWTVYAGCLSAAGLASLGSDYPVLVKLGHLKPVQMDVTKEEDIKSVMELIGKDQPEHGLYALVNNAGVGEPQLMDLTPVDEYRRIMEVNFFSVVALTKAALPLLKKTWNSRIVNVTSMAGVMLGSPLMSAYMSSKHAAEVFSASVRLECRGWGVYVSTVCPTFHRTEMADRAGENFSKFWNKMTPELQEQYGEKYRANAYKFVTSMADGWNPDNVTLVLYKAVVACRPRRQYLVGLDAKYSGSLFSMVPLRLWDWVVCKMGGDLKPAKTSKQRMNGGVTKVHANGVHGVKSA